MSYQDKWVLGKVIEEGDRECTRRYGIIRDFCKSLGKEKFSVCDIGANWCYFDFRLTQEFSGCSVVAFEFRVTKAVRDLVRHNKADRIVLLDHKIHLSEMKVLGEVCSFDVVLALSVIHHLQEPVDELIDGFLKLGQHVIVEFAGDDSARETAPPSRHQGKLLGYGDSHLLDGYQRPIVVFSRGNE